MAWFRSNKAKADADKRGRLRPDLQMLRGLQQHPRGITALIRGFLFKLWRARGGGFYGLGYVLAFIVLELRMLLGDLLQSEGIVDFVSMQLLEYLLLFGLFSLLNSLLAMIWPVYLLQQFEVWGLIMLLVGYLCFERLLRPLLEQRFPELAQRQADQESAENPE